MNICRKCKKSIDKPYKNYKGYSNNICRDCLHEWYVDYYSKNKDKIIARHNVYRPERNLKTKKIIVDYYGGKCFCCGEDNIWFLSIDHKNNDGNKHFGTAKKRMAGFGIYKWIIDNDFPDSIQILCYNCNMGKQFNTKEKYTCPHNF
jgi:hypothetical protein